MSQYKTLRVWSAFLVVLGIVSVISATFGIVSWAISVDGFWDTMAVIMFGAPVALLLATWPIAMGQMLRAVANIGDSIDFNGVPVTAR